MTGIDPARAIGLSLVVGAACTLVGLPIAVAFGWLLARGRLPARSLVSGVLLLPLVLPPVVTGFLLLRTFGRSGPVGQAFEAAGLPLTFNLAAAILAALVVGLPLYILAARGAFEAVDPRYEEVSLTLGHSPARTFRQVTLPLALPGLAAGAVLVFARALGEFGATAVVAGNIEGRTRTIALAVYSLLEVPGGDAAIVTLVIASILLSLAGVVGYEFLLRWQRRRLEIPVWLATVGVAGAATAAGMAALCGAPGPAAARQVDPILVGQMDFVVQEEGEGRDGFSLARCRLGSRFEANERFDIVGIGEFAGENPRVLDIYGRLKLGTAELTAGYFKSPLFISGRNESEELTPIPERSQLANTLWPNRDLGMEVRLLPKDSPLELTGWVGNGTTNYRANDNSSMAAALRGDLTFGRGRPGKGKEERGLRSGVAVYASDVAPRTGLSGRTVTGSTYYEAPRVHGQRLILETHHALYGKSWYVLAEAGWAREDRDSIDAVGSTPGVPAGAAIEASGVGVTVAYTLRGEPRGPSRSPRGPDTLLPWNWGGGAVELALRYDYLALGRGAADVPDGGASGGAASITWWLTDEWALAMAAYHLDFHEPPVARPNDDASDVLLARTTFRWK